MYSENNLCPKDVQNIIDGVTDMLYEPVNLFKSYLFEHIAQQYSISNNDVNEMQKFIEVFENLFKSFHSEYFRFKFLENSSSFIKPISYTEDQHLQINVNTPISKVINAQYFPIGKVFQKCFSLPNVLDETIMFIENLVSQKDIENLIQTQFWKNKISGYYKDNIVLPLFVYYDDYESGNSLGSHSGIHKLGAVYCSIACLPPCYQSVLENIYLLGLFHISDLKEFGEK